MKRNEPLKCIDGSKISCWSYDFSHFISSTNDD